MLRIIFVLLMWACSAWAVNAPVTYNANGVLGLTVRAVDTLQCTGSPPSVTINGGATIYTFSSMGSGLYQRYLPPGCYHFFETSTWKATSEIGALGKSDSMMTIITANGWVTSARILDGTIVFADMGSSSVGGAHIVDGDVTTADIANGTVSAIDLRTTWTGAVWDSNYTIDEMQDSLRALYGAWSAGDYSVDVLSDKVKTLEGTSFSGAAVSLVVAGQATGIRLIWSMNSAANYAAVRRYEIYRGDVPYLHAAGSMDSLSYANLNNVMTRTEIVQSPRAQAQSYSLPCTDTTYVVVIAVDYGGSYISSGWSSGVPGNIDVGQASSLAGTPYYSEGNSLVDVIREMSNEIAATSATVTASAKQKILVYCDRTTATAGIDQDAAVLTVHKSSELEASSKDPLRFSFMKIPGYTSAVLTVLARVGSSGTQKGYIEFDMGGFKSQATVGGTGASADTVTTEYSVTVSLNGLTDNNLYEGSCGIWVGTATDTVTVSKPWVVIQ